MSAIRHIRPSLAVGADLGGTRLRVVATRDGRVTARLTTRAPRLEDLEKFLHSVWATRGWTRRDIGALVVASRGIWTLRERRALARRLASLARRVHVLSDAQAALLGALGMGPGLLLLAGTRPTGIRPRPPCHRGRAGGLRPTV